MPDKSWRPAPPHPDEWQGDLNPNFMAGQNVGLAGAPETSGQSAYDMKEIHTLLDGFTSEDLKQIPILAAGSRLEQGATYLDLRDPSRREIKALGNMEAEPHNLFVQKKIVYYLLCNRLMGDTNPVGLGVGDVGATR
jgi:hypothetical protein